LFTRLEKTTFLLVPPLKLFIHSMIFLSSIYHNSCSKILIFDRLCVYNNNPLVLCTKKSTKHSSQMWWKLNFWWSERKKTNSRKRRFFIFVIGLFCDVWWKHKWKWRTIRNHLYSHVSEISKIQTKTLLQCNKIKWWCWVQSEAYFFLFHI